MSKGLTIAIYVMGSSICFKRKNKRSDGSSEYYKFIQTVAKRKNVDRIILLSRNDYNSLTESEQKDLDPRNIIEDPYSRFPELNTKPKTDDVDERFRYVDRIGDIFLENYDIDFGIGFLAAGYRSVTTQPGFIYTVTKPYLRAQCLDMTLFYASHIVNYLNKSGLPWWLIATDPRYIKKVMNFRDTTNVPKSIIGQYNMDLNWRSIHEFRRDTQYTIKHVPMWYSGIEKMNLIGEKTISPETERPNKFNIVSLYIEEDPGRRENRRYRILKDYVLHREEGKDVKIFGKWPESYMEGYPQFQGYVPTEVLDSTMNQTRYTFVLPTRYRWVTSKYAEILQSGIVPFLHKYYDDQCNLLEKDHFIRIKDPDDLYKKMEYLDQNPEERIQLVKELQEKFIKGVETGDFAIDIINQELQRTNNQKFQIEYEPGVSKQPQELF